METLSTIIKPVLFVLGLFFIARMAFRSVARGGSSRRKPPGAVKKGGWAGSGVVFLEAAALASVFTLFPGGASSISFFHVLMLGFGLGLILVPGLARPLLAVAVATVALSKVEPSRIPELLILLTLFVLLRWATRLVLGN